MSLPPRELSPNYRPRHWAIKSRIVTLYRQTAYLLALQHIILDMPWRMAEAQLTFHWPDKRRRDIRNFESSMKPAYDGLVSAGMLVDDDHLHLTHGRTKFCIDKLSPRVDIKVVRLEPHLPRLKHG